MHANKPQEALEALFNNAAIGIIIVNERGSITLVNRYALGQFGYTEEEIIGQKVEKLIPRRFTSNHEKHREHYHQHAHSRPMGIGMELYAMKKDKSEFPVEVSLSEYHTDEGKFAVAFINDISLRKASQEALLKLNAELEEKVTERTLSLTQALAKEMELNELKSRFVSLASHEFRTPLSTIQSSAYLISQYTENTDQNKRDKHIQRIASAVTTLTDILNDFLSVGKIEEGKILVRFTEFNIKQYTQSIIEEISPIRKKGQHIAYNHSGNEKTMLDSTLYKHIILNLLTNAIKFSDEDKEIAINTAIDQDICSIVVKDNGMGISKEDQEHLFERFFRGDNVSNIQGTGLGLHIVSKYAELMNGDIRCNSELNKGTAFTLQFNLKKNYENDTVH